MKAALVISASLMALISSYALAANAGPKDPNTSTNKFVAYCETNDTDCALFIDAILVQGFWGFPENGPACKDKPPNWQIEDGRNLILPWIRTHGFTTDPLRASLARALSALTSSLCPQIKPENSN
jgi:hypothetical protein